MKQSFSLLILQIVSIIVGFFSIFYVAAKLSPDVYALIGIYGVISTITVVFSNTGLETISIRNFLLWKKCGYLGRIKIFVSQAIFLRIILGVLLQFPLIFYSLFISGNKFSGNYLNLFLAFGFSSVFKAANDSIRLLLKAFNKYFISALSFYFVTVFGKLFALYMFSIYGLKTYLIVIMLLPIITFIPLIFLIKKWIRFKEVLGLKKIFKNLKGSKYFAITSYVSYFFNYADQLAVSIFLKPEILGSFSLGKKIFSIIKSFAANFYDPLTQKLVLYKDEKKNIEIKLDKIGKIRNYSILVYIAGLTISFVFFNEVFHLLNLMKYPYIKFFIFSVLISQLLMLFYKVEIGFISLFVDSKSFLKITIFNSFIALFFLFFFFAFVQEKYIFIYLVLTNFCVALFLKLYLKKNYNKMIENKCLL